MKWSKVNPSLPANWLEKLREEARQPRQPYVLQQSTVQQVRDIKARLSQMDISAWIREFENLVQDSLGVTGDEYSRYIVESADGHFVARVTEGDRDKTRRDVLECYKEWGWDISPEALRILNGSEQ